MHTGFTEIRAQRILGGGEGKVLCRFSAPKNPDSSWSLMPLGGLMRGLGIPEWSGESEILRSGARRRCG